MTSFFVESALRNVMHPSIRILAIVAACTLAVACGYPSSLKWTEDVRLPDGRIVTLTRYQEYHGPREIGQSRSESDYWLEFRNPDTGKTVRWESDGELATVALFLDGGVPYLLTEPGSGTAARRLNCPDPLYILFRYSDSKWTRMPLKDIPVKRLRANMTSSMPRPLLKTRPDHLGLAQTDNQYVLNNKLWDMDFAGLTEQSFGPANCEHQPDYRLVPY